MFRTFSYELLAQQLLTVTLPFKPHRRKNTNLKKRESFARQSQTRRGRFPASSGWSVGPGWTRLSLLHWDEGKVWASLNRPVGQRASAGGRRRGERDPPSALCLGRRSMRSARSLLHKQDSWAALHLQLNLGEPTLQWATKWFTVPSFTWTKVKTTTKILIHPLVYQQQLIQSASHLL